MKFKDVDTVAPGLDFFYVRTNEDGSVYIDNLYSQYNLKIKENALDDCLLMIVTKGQGSLEKIYGNKKSGETVLKIRE